MDNKIHGVHINVTGQGKVLYHTAAQHGVSNPININRFVQSRNCSELQKSDMRSMHLKENPHHLNKNFFSSLKNKQTCQNIDVWMKKPAQHHMSIPASALIPSDQALKRVFQETGILGKKRHLLVCSSPHKSVCVDCRLSNKVVFLILAMRHLGQCLRDNWKKIAFQLWWQENKKHLQ